MKTRPILFKAEMVRALLAGRKTQTRRLLGPDAADTMDFLSGCGKYKSEDPILSDPADASIFWGELKDDDGTKYKPQWLAYMDDYPEEGVLPIGVGYGRQGDLLWLRESWCRVPSGISFATDGVTNYGAGGRIPWRTGRHIARLDSRITLKITNVRVQRLQEINEADAEAEGVEKGNARLHADGQDYSGLFAVDHFAALWNSINSKRGYGWSNNPWVWALTFEVFKENVDTYLSRTESSGIAPNALA